MQPLRHILGDTIEQEGGGLAAQGARLPRPQQGAVEQEGCGGRVRGHAGWYAEAAVSGNPRPDCHEIRSEQDGRIARKIVQRTPCSAAIAPGTGRPPALLLRFNRFSKTKRLDGNSELARIIGVARGGSCLQLDRKFVLRDETVERHAQRI